MNMIRSNVCPWFKNNGISGYSDGHMELLFADPTKVETINAFGQAGRTRAVAGRTNPELGAFGSVTPPRRDSSDDRHTECIPTQTARLLP